jgi:catechol 2,3-dioxygenase-like lactoylglutathione lyase family enzyme
MFDRVSIRVSDLARSERLYRAVLGELEIEPSRTAPEAIEWGELSMLSAGEQHPPTRNLHLAFVAPDRDAVEAFWRAGLDSGALSDGEPGERQQYTPGYYGAFLRDPDDNSIEAVIHSDVRRGGHIDHLWIGVADLDDAAEFYFTIARHTGLREGRRWDEGRQFRGAWATFSLVADGRPHTKNLRLSFPAPDERAVEDFHRAATAAGYLDNGAPEAQQSHQRRCYSAHVLGPEGTDVESVFRYSG